MRWTPAQLHFARIAASDPALDDDALCRLTSVPTAGSVRTLRHRLGVPGTQWGRLFTHQTTGSIDGILAWPRSPWADVFRAAQRVDEQAVAMHTRVDVGGRLRLHPLQLEVAGRGVRPGSTGWRAAICVIRRRVRAWGPGGLAFAEQLGWDGPPKLWGAVAERRIVALAHLRPGWGGPATRALAPEAVNLAMAVARRVGRPAEIVPDGDGVAFTWHVGDVLVEAVTAGDMLEVRAESADGIQLVTTTAARLPGLLDAVWRPSGRGCAAAQL